ncbi:MAG: arginine kinase [Desulfobulbaceae bacterium]|nr:arginine kinase [Desulfobulbaceae bacterium]
MKFSLLPETSKSLVKKYLTKDIFKALEHERTDSGFTLEKAIRSVIVNPDSSIGIYAGDAQSYKTFSDIFEPIIHDYHGLSQGKKHLSTIQTVHLTDPDPERKYILSTRIRIARNLTGFSFTNHIELSQRKNLEEQIVAALFALKGEVKGEYHSFELPANGGQQAYEEKILYFKKGDRFQDAAGINADFPKCRGIFYSADKRFRVWLNEEDHMRIISQDASSDLSGVFNLLCKVIVVLEQSLDFEKDDTYGYLTSCPSNIGTTMRAGVHIRLEKLNQNRALLDSLTKAHGLQIRGTLGEKTRVDKAVFDISNHRRLGVSEVDIITNLHQGLLNIIDTEKNL